MAYMQFTFNLYTYIYLLGLPAMQKGYAFTWMQEAVHEAYAAAVEVSGPDAEFNAYLNSAPQATTDVVSWWGVHDLFIMSPLIFLSPCSVNSSQYPTLSIIACDYLPIH